MVLTGCATSVGAVRQGDHDSMEVTFLGGASGIGASCLAIQVGGRWLVVDAGVRLNTQADRLPDLAFLQDKPIAAILVTHAHADHIGALPLVHQLAPAAPIYASAATGRLIEVMLADSLRVMDRRAADELEIPLFAATLAERTLRQLRPLPVPGQVALPEVPELRLVTAPAGHVAGAASLGLDHPEGRLIISGDLSITPQRTVSPARLPALARPDLLILESTYGARAHPNRQAEEARLVQTVVERLQYGHVLIPAFALGRAQEIILILLAAQARGHAPLFPIYVDGLVRTVCGVYGTIPEALAPPLARSIRQGRDPFFGATVQAIMRPAQRAQVLAGPPACLISSSGMLTGGPSALYAAALAPNPAATILITGYQDEEAPGGRLLAAAAGESRDIELNGQPVTLHCQVGQYALSAHADGGELAGWAAALRPRTIALVHGDAASRAALGERLADLGPVRLPQDGDTLTVNPAARRGRRAAVPPPPPPVAASPPGMGGGAVLDLPGLTRLWQALVAAGPPPASRRFTAMELAQLWYGDAVTPAVLAGLRELLAGVQPYFAAVPEVPDLYRLRRRRRAPGRPPRPDTTQILAAVNRILADAPDLYHRGVDPATGAITLAFAFPAVAHQRYATQLAALAAEVGVPIHVTPQPHQERLAAAARAVLPAEWPLLQNPALHHEQQVVRVRGARPLAPAALAAAQAAFTQQTGWRLEVHVVEAAAPVLLPPSDTPGRWELNRARQAALERFAAAGCYRVSADQERGALILRFHFPDVVSERHGAQLTELAEQTGWQVDLYPQVHQAALAAAVRHALPQDTIMGQPSFHAATRVVTITCAGPLSADQIAAAQGAMATQTGWGLHIRLDLGTSAPP